MEETRDENPKVYTPLNILRVEKSRRARCVKIAEDLEATRNANQNLVPKPDEKIINFITTVADCGVCSSDLEHG